MELSEFKGNKLTPEERRYRLEQYESCKKRGIDPEMIPGCDAINDYDWIVTTQSCYGHKGDNERKAHLDFRCSLDIGTVIDNLLRPMEEIHHTSVQLMLEEKRLRYLLWFNNDTWEAEVNTFVKLVARTEKIVKPWSLKDSKEDFNDKAIRILTEDPQFNHQDFSNCGYNIFTLDEFRNLDIEPIKK